MKFRHVIIPLSRNATFTVILLSFIGGLRTFDLIWTMTRGGPGFASDVLTSVIYKKYQALAEAADGVHFVGRLATYKYYNMDQVVGQALSVYEKIAATVKSTAHFSLAMGSAASGSLYSSK